MMGNPSRHHRLRRIAFEDDDNENDNGNGNENNHRHNDGETELDREVRTGRRRSSATILQLIQGMRSGMLSELGNPGTANWDRGRDIDRDTERVILINPFNQTIIVHGSHNNAPTSSLGDYFIGPDLDLLLRHLAENDPDRYGTPPAQKEVVEGLPTVKIEETLQCSVCLDDCEMGSEVKEMPCKHKFHSGCILPWLELHSSCPVCRYQLPSEESKLDSEGSRNNSHNSNQESIRNAGNGGDERNENGRWFRVPLLWPFSSLFSSSSSQPSSGNHSASIINKMHPQLLYMQMKIEFVKVMVSVYCSSCLKFISLVFVYNLLYIPKL
ncbi:UNVERIFIED_CONTAM: E3 ubiquitin-protein ligase SIRP1 [Sesamum angustifolium]|uniref:RING-type E3 ubiquitin transferase n=1 Tax=Sesamum angustifolium TaxID=2727405 RepID=A0AAW2QNF0_9LAMI